MVDFPTFCVRRIVGVEYVVSDKVFETLADEVSMELTSTSLCFELE